MLTIVLNPISYGIARLYVLVDYVNYTFTQVESINNCSKVKKCVR